MPATVVAIAAAPGTRVAAGDPVIVLEAMKMELLVRAPARRRDRRRALPGRRAGAARRALVELTP